VFQLTPARWIIAGLVLAVLEMIIPGMVIIWLGIAGVVTGILAIFVHNQYIQFGVFVSPVGSDGRLLTADRAEDNPPRTGTGRREPVGSASAVG